MAQFPGDDWVADRWRSRARALIDSELRARGLSNQSLTAQARFGLVPPRPQGLTVTTPIGQIRIDWNEIQSFDVERYEVDVATDAAFTANYQTFVTRDNFFAFQVLAADATTRFIRCRVRSQDGNWSDYSAVVSSSPGGIPNNAGFASCAQVGTKTLQNGTFDEICSVTWTRSNAAATDLVVWAGGTFQSTGGSPTLGAMRVQAAGATMQNPDADWGLDSSKQINIGSGRAVVVHTVTQRGSIPPASLVFDLDAEALDNDGLQFVDGRMVIMEIIS